MSQFPAGFQSGFVAVMGRPNVGKSTLINHLLGTKIAATSPWPQTTRKAQMGILTLENAQIVFVDTPGFHQPIHKLGEKMVQEALRTIEECDLCLFLVDISSAPQEEDRMLAQALTELRRSLKIILALNKSDINSEELNELQKEQYDEFIPYTDAIMISSTRGDNLDQLINLIASHLPEGPPFFPEDQLTDLYESEIRSEQSAIDATYQLESPTPASGPLV